MIIVDGTGGGNQAKVTNENELLVHSHTLTAEGNAAENGDAFILHGVTHIAAATSGGMMHYKNTSSIYEVVITRIYIDCQTLTDDIIVTQELESVRTSGTDISATGIVQKNSGSASVLEGELYVSDGAADMTLASGTEYHQFLVQTLLSYVREMKATNVIAPNKIVAWGWATLDGGNGVDAEVISMSVNCYRRLVA